MSSAYPELLQELANVLRETLIKEGTPAAIAARISRKATEKVRTHFGGQQIYIPQGVAVELDERNLAIYNDFNGSNWGDLARKYALTEPHLRVIVNAVRRELRNRRQMPLFPDSNS